MDIAYHAILLTCGVCETSYQTFQLKKMYYDNTGRNARANMFGITVNFIYNCLQRIDQSKWSRSWCKTCT